MNPQSQSEGIHHHFVTASPYVYSLDFSAVTGGSADTVTVGGKTYTYGTNFFLSYPGLSTTGGAPATGNVTPVLPFNTTMYAKAVAACINAEPATYNALHLNKVPNIKAYAKNVGPVVIIFATIEGTALAGLAYTVNGGAGSVTTEFST